MTGIAIAMVAVFAFFVIRTYVWQYHARLNGVNAEAHVSRIEQVVRVGGYGEECPITYYYVIFQRGDGLETEARLLNPNQKLKQGSCVRIRYNPGHEDVATLIKIRE